MRCLKVSWRKSECYDKVNLMTKVLGIIPARIGSTRIPEKMLMDLAGKTLIERTYERSAKANCLDALIIATDSDRIAEAVRPLQARVIMTAIHHKNGTERASEALKKFDEFVPDIVVVIWGDEPLYPASVIDLCVDKLKEDSELQAVVAADKIIEPEMFAAESVVKIVTDTNDHALYISRAQIPHMYTKEPHTSYHVIGAMAMRTDFLLKYVSMTQTPLERIEGVEQLRIIENGYKLGVVKGNFHNLGVNTPEELEEVRRRYESI